MDSYVLYQSKYIEENLLEILIDIDIAYQAFKQQFPEIDSTWGYSRYNIFALTAPSNTFYQIYQELRNLIRTQLGTTQPLWFQSWLNYHTSDQLLERHTHEFDYHGYISIDPKNTITIFDDYTIENKIGQIYFGPGNKFHKVESLEEFNGARITLGFDVHSLPDNKLANYIERPMSNLSLMPLL